MPRSLQNPGSFDRWPLARRSACPNTRVFDRSPSQNAVSPASGERVVHQTLTMVEKNESAFDIVLVDLHMKTSGLAVIQHCKQRYAAGVF